MELSFLFITNFILVLYVLFVLLAKGRGRRVSSEAQHRSREVIYDAIQEANQMLVQAELEGVEIVARERLSAREVEKDYRRELRELFVDLQARSRRLEERYEGFVENLEGTTEESVHEFLQKLSACVEGQVEKEVQELQKSLAEYRRQREEFIDTQVVELLKRTLEITLGKSLNLDQHTELVIDSLEEAKREGFWQNGA